MQFLITILVGKAIFVFLFGVSINSFLKSYLKDILSEYKK